ncbi:autotransporter outer membrane beta-barrel domain-containing protein [Erwinia phyllosphaerae]|uniref:autotransporter outer membrane beta-barrel domain-containing protein n=1 Tax=Erwinia phyllosphaerae TaxID=2853256 RepID=UPI001FEE1532|nr:autotransporter outer membrane beta-barrel domain-containing protein [Erwinia phyllosphaerae]MBV4369122.1 autotransporter outer membrane beta-barrel domain-containing protein [Erwinia phyllosphaerae]
MVMKSRPFALGLLTLTLSPLSVFAAWVVTDGSTLQVTSGYDSTDISDVPLQASGQNSRLVTDSGLAFSMSGVATSVAKIIDQGSLKVNKATLSFTGIDGQVISVNNATIDIIGSTLSISGKRNFAINAKNSNVSVKDSFLLLEGAGATGISVNDGGTLTVKNTVISNQPDYASAGIVMNHYAKATLNDVKITLNGSNVSHAINIYGGYMTADNVTIDTESAKWAAILTGNASGPNSTLALSNSTINSVFTALRGMGGNMTLDNVNVTTRGTSGLAIDVNVESNAIVRGGSYQTSGERAHGVWVANKLSTLKASDTSFTTRGSGSHAAFLQFGTTELNNTKLTTSGIESFGMYTEASDPDKQGSITGDNVTVNTSGESSYGARAHGGKITLENSAITTKGASASGVGISNAGVLTLVNTPVTTFGDDASGITLAATASATISNSAIGTSGSQAHGVNADNSTINLTDVSLTTSGTDAYGIVAKNSSTGEIRNSTISTTGKGGVGIAALLSASLTGDNLTINTTGENAPGLSASLATLKLANSTITTAGTGDKSPAALYAADSAGSATNTVELDNVSLNSLAGNGVLAKGTPLNLTLTNNSVISGGNGTALRAVPNIVEKEGTVTYAKVNITAKDRARLLGDIIAESDDNEINLSLNSASVLQGATQNVNRLILDAASSWLVTGDSDVKTLQLNNGSVIFNNESGFSTLTVNGDLTDSGNFTLGTQLGDDSSPTDRILVSGTASGQYGLTINNRGGTGGITDAGILVVRVAGDASNADFKQNGTVVAGNYQYMLHKIGDGAWYLQTSLTPVTPPDEADGDAEEIDNGDVPGIDDGDVPEIDDGNVPGIDDGNIPETDGGNTPEIDDSVTPGIKAYRPETAGYLIAPYLNAAYGFAAIGTWHERLGAYQDDTMWARVSGRHDGYRAGRFSFNVNTTFVQFGGDLLTKSLADGWHLSAGPVITLGHQRSNNKDTARSLRSELSVDVGKITTNTYSLGGYLTAWNDEGAYLDNVVQVTRYSNEFTSLTSAKMDSYGVVASVETGLPLSLGGQFKLEPQLQAMGQYMNISQTYASGVKLKDQNLMVAQLREGLRLYYDSPLLKPYLQADVVQLLGRTPGVDMNNETLTPDVRRGYWQAGAGLSSQLNAHLSAYAQMKYSHSFGPGSEGYTGNIGVKYKF